MSERKDGRRAVEAPHSTTTRGGRADADSNKYSRKALLCTRQARHRAPTPTALIL